LSSSLAAGQRFMRGAWVSFAELNNWTEGHTDNEHSPYNMPACAHAGQWDD
jgi:hypothetical protein